MNVLINKLQCIVDTAIDYIYIKFYNNGVNNVMNESTGKLKDHDKIKVLD